ncbi:MAG: hypothetical protein QW346_02480 [Candidatus Micrarchaeaceae archaeon]
MIFEAELENGAVSNPKNTNGSSRKILVSSVAIVIVLIAVLFAAIKLSTSSKPATTTTPVTIAVTTTNTTTTIIPAKQSQYTFVMQIVNETNALYSFPLLPSDYIPIFIDLGPVTNPANYPAGSIFHDLTYQDSDTYGFNFTAPWLNLTSIYQAYNLTIPPTLSNPQGLPLQVTASVFVFNSADNASKMYEASYVPQGEVNRTSTINSSFVYHIISRPVNIGSNAFIVSQNVGKDLGYQSIMFLYKNYVMVLGAYYSIDNYDQNYTIGAANHIYQLIVNYTS